MLFEIGTLQYYSIYVPDNECCLIISAPFVIHNKTHTREVEELYHVLYNHTRSIVSRMDGSVNLVNNS